MITAYIIERPDGRPRLVYQGLDEEHAHRGLRRLIACAAGMSGYVERDGAKVWYRGEWLPNEPIV